MPYRLKCPKCARTGLVRKERVVSGTDAKERFYCGGCEYEWDQPAPVRERESSHRDMVPAESTIAWSIAFRDYRIRCQFFEPAPKHFVLIVIENGREIE